jgi:hypothetical protein
LALIWAARVKNGRTAGGRETYTEK